MILPPLLPDRNVSPPNTRKLRGARDVPLFGQSVQAERHDELTSKWVDENEWRASGLLSDLALRTGTGSLSDWQEMVGKAKWKAWWLWDGRAVSSDIGTLNFFCFPKDAAGDWCCLFFLKPGVVFTWLGGRSHLPRVVARNERPDLSPVSPTCSFPAMWVACKIQGPQS